MDVLSGAQINVFLTWCCDRGVDPLVAQCTDLQKRGQHRAQSECMRPRHLRHERVLVCPFYVDSFTRDETHNSFRRTTRHRLRRGDSHSSPFAPIWRHGRGVLRAASRRRPAAASDARMDPCNDDQRWSGSGMAVAGADGLREGRLVHE